MTIDELNNYYLLEGAIRDGKERIAAIEAKLCGSKPIDTSGIPKSPTPTNHVEETYIELTSLKIELGEKINRYERTKVRVERYIYGISDLLISRIMEKRVFDHKSWEDIAGELGGGNTKDSVKKMYYRFISDNPE